MRPPSHPNRSPRHHAAMDSRPVRFALGLLGVFLPLVNRTNGTLLSGGRKRSYLLYVPETRNPAVPAPLVISLHGFAEWPAHQMQISHWNDLARQHGFLVVYPCGTEFPLRWHLPGLPGSQTDSEGDVTFLSDLIDRLQCDYNLDPARIYVNGLSNGGGMAFALSCALPHRIAAFGSVSGFFPFSWSECHPLRPLPSILFHGTGDPIVPYLGGSAETGGFALPVIPEWAATLARYNGCSGLPIHLPDAGAVSGIEYPNPAANAEVVLYTIAGGGHAWPGGGALPRMLVGNTNRDIDATRIMWDFFRRHPLAGKVVMRNQTQEKETCQGQ